MGVGHKVNVGNSRKLKRAGSQKTNPMFCLLWWGVFCVKGGVFFCDCCGCGTDDVVCAQLTKLRLLMGKLCYHDVGLLFLNSNTVGGLSMITPCRNFFCHSRCDKQGDWVQNHPTRSSNDLWVSWQRFGIDSDGGGWEAMTDRTDKQTHLECPPVFLTGGTLGHCFHSMIDFLSSGRLAKLTDWTTPKLVKSWGCCESLESSKMIPTSFCLSVVCGKTGCCETFRRPLGWVCIISHDQWRRVRKQKQERQQQHEQWWWQWWQERH